MAETQATPIRYSMDDLLTLEQAAEKLHVSVRTVRGWLYKRTVPYTRLGRRNYLARTVIEEILQKNSVPPLRQQRQHHRGMQKKTLERVLGGLRSQ